MIAAENEDLLTRRFEEISSMLLPQYREKGFKLCHFFGRAIILAHYNELVFVFSSRIEVRTETISRLCEYHLGNCKLRYNTGDNRA
ncbi:MAG: hypothetical protein NUV31_00560 [Dehalococcoidales bacterium]|jgi:hypothetical protein|nr:hypothetical protein [Dehalococcoidales bacterium]